MAVYKMNDIMKTLDKLFKYNINTTEKEERSRKQVKLEYTYFDKILNSNVI